MSKGSALTSATCWMYATLAKCALEQGDMDTGWRDNFPLLGRQSYESLKDERSNPDRGSDHPRPKGRA